MVFTGDKPPPEASCSVLLSSSHYERMHAQPSQACTCMSEVGRNSCLRLSKVYTMYNGVEDFFSCCHCYSGYSMCGEKAQHVMAPIHGFMPSRWHHSHRQITHISHRQIVQYQYRQADNQTSVSSHAVGSDVGPACRSVPRSHQWYRKTDWQHGDIDPGRGCTSGAAYPLTARPLDF